MHRGEIRALLADLWLQFHPGPADFTVTRPPDDHGEWSSNFTIKLAAALRRPAASLAPELAKLLENQWIGTVEAKDGRLNFLMSEESIRNALEQAVREGAHYGAGDTLAGQRILVEYVSSDPTGPLPFSAGRHAAFGEAVCKVLEFQGARVTREFYLNDASTSSKAQLLGESVAAWLCEAFGRGSLHPEGTVDDAFVRGVAADLARREGLRLVDLPSAERVAICSRAALEAAVASQRQTLERFGVRFDEWVSEAALHQDGRLDAALQRLQDHGYTVIKDGALWLESTKLGDETDRVLRRSNGAATYLAGDIAYHVWKAERGFDKVINVWSPEHRQYIPRTRAALQAAGLNPETFEYLIVEGGVLKRDGIPLRLSSSGGPLVLDEELASLDVDGLKFLFVLRDAAKAAEVDLEIARRDDETNRSYAVRLLPSRLARLERELQARVTSAVAETEWLPGERELARLVALWPDEAREAALRREPSRIARFVLDLAVTTRDLVKLSAPDTATPERLQLVRAAQNTAASALRLLGVESRERF